jgi:hypothetical protein
MANYTQSWGSNRTSSTESSALKLKGIIGAKPSALKNTKNLEDVPGSGYSSEKQLLKEDVIDVATKRTY